MAEIEGTLLTERGVKAVPDARWRHIDRVLREVADRYATEIAGTIFAWKRDFPKFNPTEQEIASVTPELTARQAEAVLRGVATRVADNIVMHIQCETTVAFPYFNPTEREVASLMAL